MPSPDDIVDPDAVEFLTTKQAFKAWREALCTGGLIVPSLSADYVAKVEAAVFRVPQKSYYVEMTVAQLAAYYCHGFATGHCFPDGNKRTAFLAASLFCNQFGVVCKAPDKLIYRLMTWTANRGWVGLRGLVL